MTFRSALAIGFLSTVVLVSTVTVSPAADVVVPATTAAPVAPATPAANANAATAAMPTRMHDNLNAVLWDQTAVEFKATALGAYALGRLRLDEALADKTWTAATEQTGAYQDLPPAIILDVDDTVLNTSAYQAYTVMTGTGFTPESWTRYVKSKSDEPVPGAVDFTRYAASKGVKVFYVTNRSKDEEAPTVEEMKAMGFPFDETVDTFLSAKEQPDWGSAKSTRRSYIAKDYRILLLFGDNFGDFSDAFKGTLEERNQAFQGYAAHWGHDWIALANPTYGSFESAPYKGDFKLPPDSQRQMKYGALKPWSGQ